MCKVLVITNMAKIKKPKKAIEVIAKHLTVTEPHGFGYSVQGENGIFGERTTSPRGFKVDFERRVLPSEIDFVDATYNRIGEYSRPVGMGIFHGRTSTNHKTLLNTHPIQKHGWTLIHNGVVSNQGPKYETFTTNDTEHLVDSLYHGGIDAVARDLTGYYAVAAFSPDSKLHLFRDDRATLYITHVESIDAWLIGTTEDLLKSICKDLKWNHSLIGRIKDNTYLVLNGNFVESKTTFTPRGWTYNEDRFAEASLGDAAYSGSRVYSSHHRFNDETDSDTDTKYNTATPLDAVEEYYKYSEEELMFLDEVQYVDHSWEIMDHEDNLLSHHEFLSLTPDDQLGCTLIRSDGTLCDPSNYGTDILPRRVVS